MPDDVKFGQASPAVDMSLHGMMSSDAALIDTTVSDHAVDRAPEQTSHHPPSSPVSTVVPQDPWTAYKPIIKRLYIDEQRPLREVMQIMQAEHGFTSTAKSYKRRLKAWGLTKYIKFQGEHDQQVLQEAFPDGARGPSSGQRHEYVQLANIQLVDAQSLAMHLKRKARTRNAAQWRRQYALLEPLAVRAPDRFRVLEGVYANVYAYITGRFKESITTPKDVDIAREWNPHSGRWLRFSAAVQAACEEGKLGDAIVLMRQAPEELGLLLRHQPSNTLNNFFRFLAQSIRFVDPDDPAGAQFLKVVKALIKFSAAHLTQNASSLNLSTGHPLCRLFDCLAHVDDHELLEAAWKGWKIGCQSWYDMMEGPAAWSANVDYLNIAALGGCNVSEFPSNMGDILEKTLKRYEAEGRNSPKYLASLWNRTVYAELVASNSTRTLHQKVDTPKACRAVHQGELVADAGTGETTAPINSIYSIRPSRALDHYIESMKQNIPALEDEHGSGSPPVLQFIRELEYGLYELGEMELAEEVSSRWSLSL